MYTLEYILEYHTGGNIGWTFDTYCVINDVDNANRAKF